MAKARSSSTAAQVDELRAVVLQHLLQHHVDQHGEDRQQERRAQKLGRAEDAHLRAHHLDQRERRAAEGELRRKRGQGEHQAEPVAARGDAEGKEQREPTHE